MDSNHRPSDLKTEKNVDNVFVVVRRHAIVEWNSHRVGVTIAGGGIIFGPQAEPFTVIAEHMHGVRSWPGGNALSLQMLHDLISRHRGDGRIDISDERLPRVAARLG